MIEKLYTVEEVAELASVTGRTIRNYLKSGRLVGRKIGGQWRFPESEVQRLLTGGEPEPVEEVLPEEEIEVKQEQITTPDSVSAANKPPLSVSSVDYSYDTYEEYPAPVENTNNIPQTHYYEAPAAEEYYTAPPAPPLAQEQPTYHYNQTYPGGNPAPVPVPKPAPPAYSPASSSVQQGQAPRVSTFGQPSIAPQINRGHYPPQNSFPPSYREEMPLQNTGMPQQAFAPQNNYPTPPVAPAQPIYQEPLQNQQQQNYAPPSYPASAQMEYPQNIAPPVYAPSAPQVPQNPPPSSEITEHLPEEKNSTKAARNTKQKPEDKSPVGPELSDVGKQVMRFVAEVHDCSLGPQVCSIVDLHQALPAAKVTSERLAEIARQESENGQLCQSFVEFDERYFVARYTLFGTSSFLARCLKLLG